MIVVVVVIISADDFGRDGCALGLGRRGAEDAAGLREVVAGGGGGFAAEVAHACWLVWLKLGG